MSLFHPIGKDCLRAYQELNFQRVSRRSLLAAADSMGVPQDQVIRCRKRYLEECLEKLRAQLRLYYKDLEGFKQWHIWYKLTESRIAMVKEHIAIIKMDYRGLDHDLGEDNFGEKIAEAKRVPIETVMGISSARSRMYACPFHEDKHPSLKVNTDNTFHCFSCGSHGDAIDMEMKLYNVSLKEAVTKLAGYI